METLDYLQDLTVKDLIVLGQKLGKTVTVMGILREIIDDADDAVIVTRDKLQGIQSTLKLVTQEWSESFRKYECDSDEENENALRDAVFESIYLIEELMGRDGLCEDEGCPNRGKPHICNKVC